MTKLSFIQPIFNLDGGSEDHPLIEWISSHKKVLIGCVIALILTIFSAYRLISMHGMNAEADFLRAQILFKQFQQNSISKESTDLAVLQDLKNLMNKYSDLQAKFDGPLAQTLLLVGQPSLARDLLDRIAARTQSEALQLYRDYTEGSVLIDEENYKKALQNAQLLNEQIEQADLAFTAPILSILNLARLAFLNQVTHEKEEEIKIWNQIKKLKDHFRVSFTPHQMQETGVSLLFDYGDDRLLTLDSKI